MQKDTKQIQISEGLHRRLKRIAADTRGTLRGIVEEALKDYADRAEATGIGENESRVDTNRGRRKTD